MTCTEDTVSIPYSKPYCDSATDILDRVKVYFLLEDYARERPHLNSQPVICMDDGKVYDNVYEFDEIQFFYDSYHEYMCHKKRLL